MARSPITHTLPASLCRLLIAVFKTDAHRYHHVMFVPWVWSIPDTGLAAQGRKTTLTDPQKTRKRGLLFMAAKCYLWYRDRNAYLNRAWLGKSVRWHDLGTAGGESGRISGEFLHIIMPYP